VIPFVELPALDLPFGQRLDVFGVLSTVGVVVGAIIAERAARWYGPGDPAPLREVVPWLVGLGLVGGHAMHVFVYHPELLTPGDRWLVLRVWDGLSSTGGVLGGLAGLVIAFRRLGRPAGPYLDALALGTAPGWAIARVGCFLVHDHPGVRTDSWLAVAFPGGPRYDLGLCEVFVLAAIAAALFALSRARLRQGRLMGWLAVLYSPARFGLDFLRATDLPFADRRYAGLTPAQYVVAALFVVGLWLLLRAAPETTTQLTGARDRPYTRRAKRTGA
jgi:phosphatidylglycerol:prolipoprotein diacylglycerol transferase